MTKIDSQLLRYAKILSDFCAEKYNLSYWTLGNHLLLAALFFQATTSLALISMFPVFVKIITLSVLISGLGTMGIMKRLDDYCKASGNPKRCKEVYQKLCWSRYHSVKYFFMVIIMHVVSCKTLGLAITDPVIMMASTTMLGMLFLNTVAFYVVGANFPVPEDPEPTK